MSLSPAINDMCRYWGEIWRQLEILLVSALATYCLHFFWSFFSANFRGRYLGDRLSELLQIWFGKGPDIGQYAYQISSNSDKPSSRHRRRKTAEKRSEKSDSPMLSTSSSSPWLTTGVVISPGVNDVSLIEEKHFFKFLLISLSTTCRLKRGNTVWQIMI